MMFFSGKTIPWTTFLGFTIILFVVGGIISVTKGANLGVDFTGGTTITISNDDSIKLDDVETYLEQDNIY